MSPVQRTALSFGVILALAGSVGMAQSVDEFDGWMRTIDDKNQSVQQQIGRQDAKAVTADAKVLGDTFKLVEAFWEKRADGRDAVDLAKEAQARAADVAAAAASKDFDAAARQAVKVAETCTTCHRMHRPLD